MGNVLAAKGGPLQDVPERIPAKSFPNWMRPGSNLESVLLTWRIIPPSHRLATETLYVQLEMGFIQLGVLLTMITNQLLSGIILQVVGFV